MSMYLGGYECLKKSVQGNRPFGICTVVQYLWAVFVFCFINLYGVFIFLISRCVHLFFTDSLFLDTTFSIEVNKNTVLLNFSLILVS